MNLKQRAAQLEQRRQRLESGLLAAAEGATLRAVEKAQELTPPTAESLKGTNTRTGNMKQSWATASRTKPIRRGNEIETVLADDMEYASYVNDGHRMDRHFVPGLVINEESGLLEYNPDGKGGIVVGTKTAYIPGIHMVDKAKETYQRVVRGECERVAKEVLK